MANRKLTDIFVVPPISVLDVKQKYWKDIGILEDKDDIISIYKIEIRQKLL